MSDPLTTKSLFNKNLNHQCPHLLNKLYRSHLKSYNLLSTSVQQNIIILNYPTQAHPYITSCFTYKICGYYVGNYNGLLLGWTLEFKD